MKTSKELLEKEQIAKRLLADIYSCMKVCYKMNIDFFNCDVMIKVLVNHFDLSTITNENFMISIDSICNSIHGNPLKYFNFSYKKPRS